jgi:hypothetical protein
MNSLKKTRSSSAVRLLAIVGAVVIVVDHDRRHYNTLGAKRRSALSLGENLAIEPNQVAEAAKVEK